MRPRSRPTHSDDYTEKVELTGWIIAFLACFIGLIAGYFAFFVRYPDANELKKQLNSALTERDEARDELQNRSTELEKARIKIASYEGAREEREKALQERRSELDTHFKGIAAEVLKANSEEFRRQAIAQFHQHQELADKDLQKREAAVENLVKPVHEDLEKLRNHVDKTAKDHVIATTKVGESVKQLVTETSSLQKILHNPQLRGQWGEQHLRNVLDAAGMTPHVDYLEQVTLDDDAEGKSRPDVVVRIPDGAKVVIDAKAPYEHYSAAMSAEDNQAQQKLLTQHARALAAHAKELGGRNYASWMDGSPDFVLMYVPTDPMLDAAVNSEPTVWQDAWKQHRVLIATPGLLIAFMRTVALAWSGQEIQRNAQEIAKTGKEMYRRLATYSEHLSKIGRGLVQAVDAYNQGVGSFQSRVLVQARRFEDLSVVDDSQQISEPAPVEKVLRHLNAG